MTISQLLFASGNAGKIAEFEALFDRTTDAHGASSTRANKSDSGITIYTIQDAAYPEIEVAETGATFAENAELKARAYARAYTTPTLADDSGLELDHFDGWPGVASKRWHQGSDTDRNQALLEKLKGLTEKDRGAQFTTLACICVPDTQAQDMQVHFFEGVVRGTIALEPAGDNGFGYDPLFIPEGYTRTFAELGTTIKNKLSHRAQAFKKAKEWLDSQSN